MIRKEKTTTKGVGKKGQRDGKKGQREEEKGRGKREGKGEGGWGGVGVKGRKFKLTEKEKKCITNILLHCHR